MKFSARAVVAVQAPFHHSKGSNLVGKAFLTSALLLTMLLACMPLAMATVGQEQAFEPLGGVADKAAPTVLGVASALSADGNAAEQLANSVDVGDSYMTPKGVRGLLRLAGAIAVRVEDVADKAALLNEIIGPGGPLAGYTVGAEYNSVITVLKASPTERQHQKASPAALQQAINAVRGVPGVRFANPVFVDPQSGLWLIATEEIIIRLAPATDPRAYFGVYWGNVRRLRGTSDQFILTLPGAAAEQILAEVNQLDADPLVRWAEPNFLGQLIEHTNDPYYPEQWHLNNTGQCGGTSDADIDAPEAWAATTGSDEITVAILDCGTQTDHPDLAPNLWVNAGEIPGDDIDNDNNGYVDDVNGWDFYTGYPPGNNDPNPKTSSDNHGTAVAGVAVARGDNGVGVASPAYTSKVLPIRVAGGSYYPAGMAEAIYYAAGGTEDGLGTWDAADVLNMSLGFSQSSVVDDALTWAATSGRDGKGCPIFVSTGNSASGYVWYGVPTSARVAGTYELEFEYIKDPAGTAGDDRVWVSNVVLPDAAGTRERFDVPSMPSGWSGGGNASFTIVDDPAHAYGTGRYEARSGTIGNSQTTYLDSEAFTLVPGNECSFRAWVSSEKGTDTSLSYPPNGDDGDWLFVWLHNLGTGEWHGYFVDAGIPGNRRSVSGNAVTTAISYPASHPDTIAVGASTNFDYRADYSQYGTGLDFVAPSSGGSLGIYTTDRTGTDGNVDGDYDSDFGGTSAASPLAAGIGALALSVNPELTASQVRNVMRNSCDPIGGYPGGWNPYYGYGRVNAHTTLIRAADPVSQAKGLPDDSPVELVLKIVTAVFANYFYVEEFDRSSGIKVIPAEMPAGIAPDDEVCVVGTVQTNPVDGERFIEIDIDGIASVQTTTRTVEPCALINRAIGGGDWNYDPGTGASQKGVAGASGLNNIGLLVTTWGKVTQIGSGYLYIDDGSNLKDGTLTGAEENIGVRVICDPSGYISDDYLIVTGISSCFGTPSGLARRILTRQSEDLDKVWP